MARRVSSKLVVKQLAAISKSGKHSDGNGLYLRVRPNGTRSWIVILIGENPARWKGHIELMMPRRKKSKGHHAAMPYQDVPHLIQKLAMRPALAARALEFTILTAARTGETFGMTWQEVNMQAKLWTIPAMRMKAEAEHVVPLSDRAMDVLQSLKPASSCSGALVFPAQRGGKLSNMAMSMLLRRMGEKDITVHGFRSSFRDWAGEETEVDRETIEMALAHTIESKRCFGLPITHKCVRRVSRRV
jgi:integrase